MSPANQILVTIALIVGIVAGGLYVANSVKCFDLWPFKGAACVMK